MMQIRKRTEGNQIRNFLEITKIDQKDNSPRSVQVMVEFLRIGEIDTMNEKYDAEINFEATWTEDEQIPYYDPNNHWNPMLYIENLLIERTSAITYSLRHDDGSTVITEHHNIKGTFWERLELYNFPVDIQELSITLVARNTSREVNLINHHHKLSTINMLASRTFVDQQKWRLFKLVKVSQTASYDKGSGSSVIIVQNNRLNNNNCTLYEKSKPSKFCATCYCVRRPSYYYLNAYFLIFLITGSSLTIFSVDRTLPQNRLQTAFTILLTSVSFKWVINRSLPTISYSTSLDKYSIVCIFYLCMQCVWHAIISAFWRDDEYGKIVDQWAFISFVIFFLIINTIFILILLSAYGAIRKLKKDEIKFLDTYKKQISANEVTVSLENEKT